MQKIVPERDTKLKELFKAIENKIENPINKGNKKVLIFTAFADTANYLYENLKNFNKNYLGLETAKVIGSDQNECTLNIRKNFNNILTYFSPKSKERGESLRGEKEIDVLIATDCISEGQNLQDCDMLINYDIH